MNRQVLKRTTLGREDGNVRVALLKEVAQALVAHQKAMPRRILLAVRPQREQKTNLTLLNSSFSANK